MIDHDMGFALDRWLRVVKLKTLVTDVVRFQPVRAVTVQMINAVVQPTKPELIVKLQLDRSLRTYTIHSKIPLETGQFFEYRGADFRIVELLGWGDYGYYEAVGQDTREPLLTEPEPEEPEPEEPEE